MFLPLRSERPVLRSFLGTCAVVVLCIVLAACSGSTSATLAPTGGGQSSAVAPASTRVAPSAPAVGTSSGPGNGAAHPCALLTQTEAVAAIGQDLNAGVEDVRLGTCAFNSSDFAAGISLTVGDWDSIKAAATAGKTAPTTVSGVGDEALNLNGSNGSLLYVRKGGTGILITMNGPSVDSLADHGLAKEEALARLILPRL